MLLGAGYSEFTDENTTGPSVSARKDSNVFQVGGYAQHLETGLFVHAAYGYEDNNDTLINTSAGTRVAQDSDHWYVKSGIRKKWTPLGATIVYGDYAEYLDQLGPAALALNATDSTFRRYGGGIAQEIDAAAMTVYVKYQHYDADISGASLRNVVTDLDSADFVSFGGVVSF